MTQTISSAFIKDVFKILLDNSLSVDDATLQLSSIHAELCKIHQSLEDYQNRLLDLEAAGCEDPIVEQDVDRILTDEVISSYIINKFRSLYSAKFFDSNHL